jgi:hypothetical protein
VSRDPQAGALGKDGRLSHLGGRAPAWRLFCFPSSRLLPVLAAAMFMTVPCLLRAQSDAAEYRVKAAFLFHFAQFVDWPADAFKDGNSPMTYCIIGEDPFHGALDETLKGKVIGARPVTVQHLKQSQQVQGCQILFIAAGETKRLSATLASMKGSPVLTVGESEHFAQDGGMIGFFLEENKIRFEINLETATQAKLKISARLLALAKTVIGDPRGN